MKTLTVRVPEKVVAEIEAEATRRKVPKSDVVRERLQQPYRAGAQNKGSMHDLIGDLVGSVKDLPGDMSSNHDKYLPYLIRAKKLHRR